MRCYLSVIKRDKKMASAASKILLPGVPAGKLVHLALPVRLTHAANGARGAAELACTFDIHPGGARLLSSREVSVGDLLTVERGRGKAVCRVVWTADPESDLRGQFTVECVEPGRAPWEEELRQAQEQYLPVILGRPQTRYSITGMRRGEANRRRRRRFPVDGEADLTLIGGQSRLEGQVQEISECGCRIAAGDLLAPGTDLRLSLNIFDISVALKAQVKYMAKNLGMGVEFQEIRQGDRPLLDYLLHKLKTKSIEEFAKVEVVTEPLRAAAAAAG
jgi:hypothetical protein